MANNDSLIGLVEVPKEQAQVMLEAGRFYHEMGNYQAAEDIYKGCSYLLQRSDVPLIFLGQLYVSQDRFDEAIESYKKAIEIQPESAGAHVFLGEAYLLQGGTDQAIPLLEKAEQLDPEVAGEHARSLLEAQKLGVFS